jgi:hypothetical protein
MRRYLILLLAVALVLLAGLPADQPSSVATVEADAPTLDRAFTVPLDSDALLAISPAETWTRSPSGPISDHPSAWARDRAVVPTVARAPPRLGAA